MRLQVPIDPDGPIYIALSSIEAVTRQMLEAVSALHAAG